MRYCPGGAKHIYKKHNSNLPRRGKTYIRKKENTNLPQRGKTYIREAMPDTYSQIYYHIVFAVRNRKALITAEIKDDLYKYITGIVTNHKQKLLIINGMPDHVHILLNCKPDMNLSALVREIKEHSTKYINDKKLLSDKFYWQAGFGAFSVSGRALSIVINYIKTQEEHHSAKDFKTEYLEFLKEYEIEYKEEYLFNFELS